MKANMLRHKTVLSDLLRRLLEYSLHFISSLAAFWDCSQIRKWRTKRPNLQLVTLMKRGSNLAIDIWQTRHKFINIMHGKISYSLDVFFVRLLFHLLHWFLGPFYSPIMSHHQIPFLRSSRLSLRRSFVKYAIPHSCTLCYILG